MRTAGRTSNRKHIIHPPKRTHRIPKRPLDRVPLRDIHLGRIDGLVVGVGVEFAAQGAKALDVGVGDEDFHAGIGQPW